MMTTKALKPARSCVSSSTTLPTRIWTSTSSSAQSTASQTRLASPRLSARSSCTSISLPALTFVYFEIPRMLLSHKRTSPEPSPTLPRPNSAPMTSALRGSTPAATDPRPTTRIARLADALFAVKEEGQGGLLPAQSGGRDWGEVVDGRGTGPSIRLLYANLPEIGQHGVGVRGARVLGGAFGKGGSDKETRRGGPFSFS